MHLPYYQLTIGESKSIFEFTSVGPKGEIPKIIVFSKKEGENIYNLAFGDVEEKTGKVNDRIVSNNGDRDIVLATVVRAVLIFLNFNSTCKVYVKGSTKSRTRLYRMGISRYYKNVSKELYILGYTSEKWEEFEINKHYNSFVIQLKKI